MCLGSPWTQVFLVFQAGLKIPECNRGNTVSLDTASRATPHLKKWEVCSLKELIVERE